MGLPLRLPDIRRSSTLAAGLSPFLQQPPSTFRARLQSADQSLGCEQRRETRQLVVMGQDRAGERTPQVEHVRPAVRDERVACRIFPRAGPVTVTKSTSLAPADRNVCTTNSRSRSICGSIRCVTRYGFAANL